MGNPTPRPPRYEVKAYQYPIGHIRTMLLKPKLDPSFNFFEAIKMRRSEKRLKNLLGNQLDYLLWFSAKAHAVTGENGYLFSHRPSPSAGAIHPIDIIIHQPSNSVLEYYNPFEHCLYPLDFPDNIVSAFLDHVALAFPDRDGVLMWFVGHGYRTAAGYTNHESLVWRDAGALIQTIQLTAVSLGLVSCPVGSLAEPFIGQLFNGLEDITSGGGIIVGNTC